MLAPMGKALIAAGFLIAVAGLVLLLSDKVGWIGRLPGDITIRRGNFTFHLPLATCLVVSILLSLLLWLFRK